jgi:hypothetical protein
MFTSARSRAGKHGKKESRRGRDGDGTLFGTVVSFEFGDGKFSAHP